MALFSILVDIAAKTAGFEEGIKRVESKLEGFQRTATNTIKTLASLGGVTLGATAFASFIKGSLSAADAVGDVADRVGILASEMSRLKFIGEQSDVSFESLTVGIKKFQDVTSNAAAGNTAAADSLARIGVNASQLRGLRLEDQLGIIADEFKNLTNAEDRTSVAQDLFGKSGQDLVPLLLKGKEGLAELAAEADRLGITLDDRATKSIDRSAKALDRFWESVKGGTSNRIGGLVADIFGSGDELLDAEAQLKKLTDLREAFLISNAGNTNLPIFGELDKQIAKQKELVEAMSSTKNERSASEKLASNAINETRSSLDKYISAQTYLAEISIKTSIQDSEAWRKRAKEIDDATDELNIAFADSYRRMNQLSMTANEKEVQQWEEKEDAINALLERGTIDQAEADKRMQASNEEHLKEIVITQKSITKSGKDETDKMSQYWKQAQRNMQNSFADFLYDPFKDGLRGMLHSFVDTIHRMAAEAASAQIFDKLTKSSDGQSGFGALASWIGGFFGGGGTSVKGGNTDVPQFAGGGSFMVGGSGGTDSQMVRFMASPNERVTVSRPGQSSGEIHVHNHNSYFVDRDVSDEKLMAFGQRIVISTLSGIKNARRRGAT